MTAQPPTGGLGGATRCWCCGRHEQADSVVHLGSHPEVAVCLRCAHSLHKQARSLEDAERTSPAARGRDVLRAARSAVVQHGWHQQPGIGPVLRWLGKHTP